MSSFIDNSNTRVKDIAIILTRDNRFGTKPRDLVNGAAHGKPECRKIDSAFDVLDTAMLDTAFDVLDT